jgi:hypothetical protein
MGEAGRGWRVGTIKRKHPRLAPRVLNALRNDR